MFDSFFRSPMLIFNKGVWDFVCVRVCVLSNWYISKGRQWRKERKYYLQPHIGTDVCVWYSFLNLKYLNKVNIPGGRTVCAKPQKNERERDVLGIAVLPPSASITLILSPWKSREREDWRMVQPDKGGSSWCFCHKACRLFSKPCGDSAEQSLGEISISEGPGCSLVEEAETKRPLKSLFQDQAGADRGSE